MLPFASRAHFLPHQNFRIRIALRDGSVNEVARNSRIHVLPQIHNPPAFPRIRRKDRDRSFMKPSLV